jgi:hypothetical protein
VITLHTFENAYDDGNQYHQFLQHGRQHLLDSLAVGQPPGDELRQFLVNSIIGDCLVEPDVSDRNRDRFERLLNAVLESGDVDKLLDYAGRVCVHGRPVTDPLRTRYGEWTYDACVIVKPTLRELQEDVWASDPQFPRSDWKHEVENDETHQGYWEWVESQREVVADEPVVLPLSDPAEAPQPDPGFRLVVGALYETQAGDHVRIVGRNAKHRGYETVFDKRDAHRYDRSTHDSDTGRCTGTAHDYSHPGNLRKDEDGEFVRVGVSPWDPGTVVRWNDPGGGVCSRQGTLKSARWIGDSSEGALSIVMDDDWEAEVLERELEVLSPLGYARLRFRPQAWDNNQLREVTPEDESTWIVPLAGLLAVFKDEQEWLGKHEERDNMRYEGTAPRWIRDWSGPFEVELEDDPEKVWSGRPDSN